MKSVMSRSTSLFIILPVSALIYISYVAVTELTSMRYYKRIGDQAEEPGYTWRNSDGLILTGHTFTLPEYLLADLGVPLTSFITLNENNFSNFVFVTGASADHFAESTALVKSIQHYFAGKDLYYFDLGLTKEQVGEVMSWCNVTYKTFDVRKYPPHVANLHFYAFKPLIIYEILRDHDGVFYIDSSVRFKTGRLNRVYKLAMDTGGVVHFSHTGHAISTATDPRMYRYLVTDIEKAKRTEMTEGGVILLYRTQVVYERFFHWWLMCALDVECIAPRGASHKCDGDFTQAEFTGCHRFDQSAASILLANMNNFNVSSYSTVNRRYVIVERRTKNVSLNTC